MRNENEILEKKRLFIDHWAHFSIFSNQTVKEDLFSDLSKDIHMINRTISKKDQNENRRHAFETFQRSKYMFLRKRRTRTHVIVIYLFPEIEKKHVKILPLFSMKTERNQTAKQRGIQWKAMWENVMSLKESFFWNRMFIRIEKIFLSMSTYTIDLFLEKIFLVIFLDRSNAILLIVWPLNGNDLISFCSNIDLNWQLYFEKCLRKKIYSGLWIISLEKIFFSTRFFQWVWWKDCTNETGQFQSIRFSLHFLRLTYFRHSGIIVCAGYLDKGDITRGIHFKQTKVVNIKVMKKWKELATKLPMMSKYKIRREFEIN